MTETKPDNQPIPVSRVRAAIAKLRELEGKATKGPLGVRHGTGNGWEIFCPQGTVAIEAWHGGIETAHLAEQFKADGDVLFALRILGPVMLEYVEEAFYGCRDHDKIGGGSKLYPVCRALVTWAEGKA